jgi:mannonate dehydratase
LHPDDPPVPSLGGIPRLFRSFDAFQRAVELVGSPAFGLNFCLGSWSEMGPGVVDAIRYFGERDRIVYVHFRDVLGTVPRFRECFLGEGNVDVFEALRTLEATGFSGFLVDDHVPILVDDPLEYSNLGKGHVHAIGYMSALVDAVHRAG